MFFARLQALSEDGFDVGGVRVYPNTFTNNSRRKPSWELFFFGRADIVLDLLVQEIRFVHFPCGCYLLGIERREVLLNDTILKKHGVIYLVEYSGLEREGAFYLTSFNTVSGSQSIRIMAESLLPKSLTE